MLLTYFVVSLFLQLLLFVPAYLIKTDKLTDFSYSLGFVLVSVWAFLNGGRNVYQILLFLMIFSWSMRLGAFLVYRITKTGVDKRFDEIRVNFWRFLSFWVFQGFVIPLILLPSIYFFKNNPEFSLSIVVGFCVWLLGLLIESVSDIQKFNFKSDPKNKNKWINVGLWKHSRHPNYLGEIMCWVGIYVFASSSLYQFEKIYGLISPLTIITLLVFVSGIPILEKKADERWGKDKAYQEYKRRTSKLIPSIF